jgi:hypothetical protein
MMHCTIHCCGKPHEHSKYVAKVTYMIAKASAATDILKFV